MIDFIGKTVYCYNIKKQKDITIISTSRILGEYDKDNFFYKIEKPLKNFESFFAEGAIYRNYITVDQKSLDFILDKEIEKNFDKIFFSFDIFVLEEDIKEYLLEKIKGYYNAIILHNQEIINNIKLIEEV